MRPSTDVLRLAPDERGRASLDGFWDFFPEPLGLDDLPHAEPVPIRVPALWEAEGWLELDGPAWYRRRFELPAGELDGWWTLRFGAVMDTAEVHLNGTLVATHDSPFTPFEIDVGPHLVAGCNELAVRVVDHPLDSPEHIRSAHGKQGWANHVFPSRPSLYMTYGGIWQPVTLRRHGPVRIDDVFLNSDPRDLRAWITVSNVSRQDRNARLGLRSVGAAVECEVSVAAGATHVEELRLGPTPVPRWSPTTPVLHDALVDVQDGDRSSDATKVRFGLRTLEIEGTGLLVNGEPYRMRSALVQGFRADSLYAEGTREAIVDEVRAALDMGFNTLRLHIKAFDPTYLDVCDELGMLLHCDLPVAEPIAHAEMGYDTELADRCARAIDEQVRRDRNHPSVLLWSAMNELTLDGLEWRSTPGYEGFARRLAAAVEDADPTRPYIENDWVEPEPERVFTAPVLTAHWYGRLHADYLVKLEQDCRRFRHVTKPLFVTELGDWGLPDMPELGEPPFWDTRTVYATGLATSQWPDTVERFVVETQRYQGISDRLQAEVLRRHDHIGGYCLTELTDVPHELNGFLDLHRRPKPLAVAEVARLNQPVLPIIHLSTLVTAVGEPVGGPLSVANDGPEVPDAELRIGFGGPDRSSVVVRRLGPLRAHRVSRFATPRIPAPERPGNHDLVVEVWSEGRVVGANRYPIHAVTPRDDGLELRVLDDHEVVREALRAVGARPGTNGPLVVGEGALDRATGAEVAKEVAVGQTVLVLAQGPRAAPHYPMPVEVEETTTRWGSSEFHFTTDSGAMRSLPRRNLLVGEDSTVQARSVLTSVEGRPFPDEPAVIAYKPVPEGVTGTIVGAHAVGAGRLVFCQYRVLVRAIEGDAAARGILADLVTWAAAPRSPLERTDVHREDGRVLRLYTWEGA